METFVFIWFTCFITAIFLIVHHIYILYCMRRHYEYFTLGKSHIFFKLIYNFFVATKLNNSKPYYIILLYRHFIPYAYRAIDATIINVGTRGA